MKMYITVCNAKARRVRYAIEIHLEIQTVKLLICSDNQCSNYWGEGGWIDPPLPIVVLGTITLLHVYPSLKWDWH